MKALVFLILLGAGVMAWAMWTSPAKFSKVEPVAETEPAVQASAPRPAAASAPATGGISLPAQTAPQKPLQVTVDDLVIVRGHVAGDLDGLLVVDCPPESSAASSGFTPNLGPTAGVAEVQAMARWAVQVQKHNEEREFGMLEGVPTGYRREVERCEAVVGRVVVHGYGTMKDAIHLVAAETGSTYDGLPLYTLNYSVRMSKQTQPPSSVTWSPFPEGVDTPEQKREHLQRLAEQKRRQTAGQR